MAQIKQSSAILINGPSSSGKTTLSKALQDALPGMFLHLGIDKVIGFMPQKYLWGGREERLGYAWNAPTVVDGQTLVELHVGPYGWEVERLLKTMAVAALNNGHSIILDVVEISDSAVSEWRAALSEFAVLYVGVTCDVNELERREIARGDRMHGTARVQHAAVHVGATYDLVLDSSKLATHAMVEEILASFPIIRKYVSDATHC